MFWPMPEAVDLITVVHNETNTAQSHALEERITEVHDDLDWTFTRWDNRVRNLGFAKACNLGAKDGSAPIIGFVNPDLQVNGPFLPAVRTALRDPLVVITGSNFGKPEHEYRRFWGCDEWICGAAFFVRRTWWDELGGFDEVFVWSWEETDFIRRTQAAGGKVKPVPLALQHDSPAEDTVNDSAYKKKHFAKGARVFYERWPR